MAKRGPGLVRLGMLTPSSNTVLEPVIAAMLRDTPDISAHFGRFPVTEISLSEDALDQFASVPILAAAEMLADAKVATICWNGTSAGWLGFAADRALCHEIEARTGIPACSSVLGLNEILERTEAQKIAVVTPYLDEIQERILANYRAAGFEIVAERHLRGRGNFSFSEYPEAQIADLCREVSQACPDAIIVFCTNFRGAGVAAEIEAETGVQVYDTIATGLWAAMRQAGADPTRIKGWGTLFARST